MNRTAWKKMVAALLCLGMMAFSSGSLFAGDLDRDQDRDKDRLYQTDPQHDPPPDRDMDRDRDQDRDKDQLNDLELLILEKGKKK